ncbi:MAG TPA: DinB family protein [Candidatus Binatia bacterium]|nr:DinB family protein [Candidatus Binatia bacterium]
MNPQTTTDRFQKEIHTFLEETFDQVHGIYLDKGTSFFETLAGVSPAEASERATAGSGSVAAHVKHVSYYLRVLQQALRGETLGKLNWREIWEQDRPVSAEEWRAITEELRGELAGLRKLLEAPETWERDDTVGESMAVLAHTAYHLGAVRQALAVIRGREGAP